MSVDADDVQSTIELYSQSAEFTWSRTETLSVVEAELFRRVLAHELTAAKLSIADVGGGNGRWAYWLADHGHDVHLTDVTPALIDDAKTRGGPSNSLRSIHVADARDLPYETSSMDVAIVFGPMYGLLRRSERIRALGEVARIVRPGGRIFIQYLTRMAGLRNLLQYAVGKAGLFDWASYLQTGVFTDPSIPQFYRASAWLTETEIVSEIEDSVLTLVRIIGMDGPLASAGQQALVSLASPDVTSQWTDIAERIGSTPETRATCDHLLAIARTPEAR